MEYNVSQIMLDRPPKKAGVPQGDKLALLRMFRHHASGVVKVGTNAAILAAIEEDVRAKDNAPARTGAPVLKPEVRAECTGSIPPKATERKLDLSPYGELSVRVDHGHIVLTHESICALTLTPDQALTLADALGELADDLIADRRAREWSRKMLETMK